MLAAFTIHTYQKLIRSNTSTSVSDVVYDGRSLGKAFTMRHDILVDHQKQGLFVLDTKYKHLTRFEGNEDVKRSVMNEVAQPDLYQIIEYAAHRDLDKAYLLYPMYRFEEAEPHDVVLERKSVSGKIIQVHVVRLPFIFEENLEKTKENLRRSITQIFS
jgi:5-methylcytosine-specific restriction endonuclease McrBC regulatory subunit McrC